MIFGAVPVAEAKACVLAHSVMFEGGRLPKGHIVTEEDIVTLTAARVETVIAARLEPGDIGEDEAASRLAEAIPPDGVSASPAATGRVNFHAETNGLFRADRALVDAFNAIHPALTLATLADRAPVRKGDLVATIKIIPLAVSAELADKGRALLASGPAFSVRPFASLTAGLIATVLPSLKPSVMDKTKRLTEDRLRPSGSRIVEEARCPHDAQAVAAHIADFAKRYGLVIVFGASAMTDEGDVIPAAIRLAGGELAIAGMPVDPGNLLVLGYVRGVPVIGAPGCARSPKENGFDWILNRILAGERPSQKDAASLGVGGLLMEIPLRPLPREKATEEPHRPTVGIAVLAAGRASRMGGEKHKLLAEFSGEPLVRRSVAAALAAGAEKVAVVTGHRADEIGQALAGLEIESVHNADFATGMASSIRSGVEALRGTDGIVIALADMPGVTADDYAKLIDVFRREGGNAIVRAVSAGKRGNPVILPKTLYPALVRLEGDVGARHIIEKSGLPVIDVEIGEAAHLDVDTIEAIKAAGGVLKG
ncbi:MAG TPA: molybdopterin-binding/glycosyltransferase family 2 protein [Ensifer sp.]|nr:molybdopterin-binding/glycosyltransferase family 2 protein [Ensifer sp.]